jgi:type VI secretion system secreted protein VgrG
MPLDQSKRQIGIDTPLGANVLVLRNFTATEELGRLFQIDAELLSENFQISFPQIVGQNVTIRLNTIQAAPRFFNGHVRAFRQTGAVGRLARYQAAIVPKLWFLTRSADCRIFQNKKVPDIVKEVLQERGITEIEDTLTASYPQWEYCVQYRETDFNFVSRLMEQEGIHYYFKHAQGSHTLVLADGDSSHPAFPGYTNLSFHQANRGVVNLQSIREWTMAQEVEPGRYVLNDYDFEKPKISLKATANVDRQNIEANHEMYDYPGEYTKLEDGQRDARTRIEEVQCGFETAYAVGDVRGVAAGFKFKLSGAPRSDQNDNYLVVSTITQAESEGFLSEGGPDGTAAFGCSFTAVRATTPFRPARLTPKPIIQGAQTAVVTGPKGEEIYTDKYGRVKVQFFWDRKGKKDENTTCFIRVAEPWSGKRWGSTFTPRIGQEVVVNFLEGDPDQPLIIGSVYNGDQMPPYLGEGFDGKHKHDPKVSGVKSCSTKGGQGYNELRFDDNKGKEQVFIHAEKDLDCRIKATERRTIGGALHLTVGFEDKDGQLRGVFLQDVYKGKQTHVGENYFTYTDDTHVLFVGKGGEYAQKITSDGSCKQSALQLFSFKAGERVVIEADIEICLTCGPSFIQLTPAGIFINGPMVYVNSGGASSSADAVNFEEPEQAAAADNSKSGSPSNPPAE